MTTSKVTVTLTFDSADEAVEFLASRKVEKAAAKPKPTPQEAPAPAEQAPAPAAQAPAPAAQAPAAQAPAAQAPAAQAPAAQAPAAQAPAAQAPAAQAPAPAAQAPVPATPKVRKYEDTNFASRIANQVKLNRVAEMRGILADFGVKSGRDLKPEQLEAFEVALLALEATA